MDYLLRRICPPNSSSVLDGNGFSECFSDIVLGFGGNLISLILLSILGISTRNGWQRQKKPFCGRSLLLFLPILGLSTSLVDMVLVLKRGPHGDFFLFHALLRTCSQLVVWVMILLLSKCDHWHLIFINRVLCFWWILKPLLAIPHLQTTLSILETRCLPELGTVLLDIAFGVYVNITRLKWRSCRSRCSSTEESLLEHDNDLEEGQVNDLERSWSYWRMMTFKFINPVMSLGATKQLDFTDLLQLPSDMDPSYCHQELLSCWRVQQTNGYSQPSLFRAICASYGWQYASLGVLKVLNDCIGFLGPVLLNKLIRFLQQGSGNLDGFGIAVCLGIASISKSFLDTQYTFHLSKLKLKLRSSLMILIYRKCLCVSLAERSKFSEGEIQTFMSIDADRIVNLGNSFHDIWSLPLQIGIALYLLYTQVKFAFLSGLAIVILLIPVNKWIAELIASATGKMMKQKDERIRRTGELLTYIRTLKMYGWELLFTDWLMKTRSTEVKHLSTRKYLDAWCVFFWATTPTLFSFFTFGLFTLMGNQLDAAMVFTCLALFNTLISPLNSFPWVINGLIDAIISTRRLSRFLSCPEHTGSPISSFNDLSNVNDDMVVVVQDAICSWSSTEEGEQNFVLNHITLQLPKGQMIAIVGEVGSGKSSLLSSILGETRLISGLIHFKGSVAYVPQVPWILYGTIRNNILFGTDYDPQRYSDVLKVCALDTDISQMVGGDMAYIGEKGANLSGGQKARLALARAIYQCCDVFLLDDILSAVDAHVAQWILTNAIFGPLMNQQTRVLCTHNIQAITAADKIIIMDKGSIKWLGSPSEFPMSSYSDSSLKCYDTSVTPNEEFSLTSKDQQGVQLEWNSEIIQEGAQEIDEVEVRKEGKVEPAVYKNYATFSGWFTVCIICISAILMQASRNGNDLWLSYWVDTTRGTPPTDYSMSFYLIVLCIFCVVNSALTLVRAFSFAFGGLRAAVQVHDMLISKLVNAPVYFFDQTPGGRILNRFSSDLYTIDDSLPFIMNILLANLVGLLGIAIVLSYVQVLFLLVLIPFWYFYSKLQFYYRSTSRELRRLDSVSRSPIYSTFTETLDGSSTIRAFGSQDLFMTRFIEHVMLYQKTSYSEFAASLWLSLRLQLIGAFVVSFIAVMAVVGSQGKLPISLGTPGLVGLALSYAAPIVSLLGSFLTSFTETEKEMVAVERVLQYMDVPQEEIQGCQSLNPGWPSEGCVEFQNVTLRYKPSLPAALSDVSFTIAGGLQVGIIGRTGAGKSSILNALFRLAPICKGCILVDGINVANLSVRDLRRSFAVVPQNPFLFEGTLRDNLDPFQQFDDSKIWSSLEKCHIKQEIQTAGGLDVHVKQSGTSFSVGQRQLICLARAFLKSSKVLCLDECTANVDTQTSSILQNAISNECRGTTVITIAHRISTVAKMDSILILDHGVLVEQGNPQVLLRDKTSRFSSFAKASIM